MHRANWRFICGSRLLPSKIANHRSCAAQDQQWLCFYCDLPMSGAGSPYGKLLSNVGDQFCSTAEHLSARQDGGSNCRTNIVAAHAICNRRRHRRGTPVDPEAFRELVQRRLLRRRWFDAKQFQSLKSAFEAYPNCIKLKDFGRGWQKLLGDLTTI